MSISNSFTYIISSNDRTNSIGTNTNTYDIDFGGFNENYETYNIEILSVLLTENTLETNSTLLLVANDLAYNGYFCVGSLNTSKNSALTKPTIIAIIPLLANVDMHNSGSGGISFVVKHCRLKRKIRFKLINKDYTDAISGTDINVNAETKWYITMRCTGIE